MIQWIRTSRLSIKNSLSHLVRDVAESVVLVARHHHRHELRPVLSSILSQLAKPSLSQEPWKKLILLKLRALAKVNPAPSSKASDGTNASRQLSQFRVQGAGCRVQGAGCRIQGAEFRVQGAGFRVQGFGVPEFKVVALLAGRGVLVLHVRCQNCPAPDVGCERERERARVRERES